MQKYYKFSKGMFLKFLLIVIYLLKTEIYIKIIRTKLNRYIKFDFVDLMSI